jgi:hypothetical protein
MFVEITGCDFVKLNKLGVCICSHLQLRKWIVNINFIRNKLSYL